MELKGRYPQILDHPRHGEAARELFEAANELLDTIVAEGSLRARGVYGFWHACPKAMTSSSRTARGSRCSGNSPTTATTVRAVRSPTSSRPLDLDHLGAFAVTAGIGADELAGRFEADHDDYGSIMVKALADRLAEGSAGDHARARREWYESGPAMSNDELIAER